MDEPPNPHDLLEAARNDFAFFYDHAVPDEKGAMDELVMRHAALLMLLNAPRGSEMDAELERSTREAEQAFMASRDRVRAGAAYAALTFDQHVAIERVLCTVRVPE